MSRTRESLQDRIQRATREFIEIVPYDASWPALYRQETARLRTLLAPYLERIEHFGSTAIPGIAAKPIVDILVGVETPAVAREEVAPILEKAQYEYFWRTDVPEPYGWFIKRSTAGKRTHHVHVVALTSTMWERLMFRDALRQHPELARRYEELKYALAAAHARNREAYTKGKTDFINAVMADARDDYDKI